MKVMTYSDKVKSSKVMLDIINSLNDDESIQFTYNKGFKGEPNVYKIKCYKNEEGIPSYSIWSNYSGMNVEKITGTMVKCYTYDMMSQRTSYNFPLNEMLMISTSN